MKNTKYIIAGILGLTMVLSTTSCKKKGCTDADATNYDANAKKDDGSCEFDTISDHSDHEGSHVMIKMEHNYNGAAFMPSDFDTIKFTNDKGTKHSVTKLQYLISDFVMYKADGDSIVVEGYNFVDFTNTNTFAYSFPSELHIPNGDYTGIGFTWGFDEADNSSGTYADLNSASWSWPAMIGGGYHFMKFEGKFIETNTDTTSFALHNGTASNSGTHEANHFYVKLNQSFTLSNDASISVKMDLSEWFKNPTQWDLDLLHGMLMPNYSAQKQMNANGRSVFSFGTVTQ